MAKPFKNLRDKMSPEARAASTKKTRQLLANLEVSKDDLPEAEVINNDGDIVIVSSSNRPRAYSRIHKLASEVFESKDQATLWLYDRQYALGDNRPVDHMRTAKGAKEVEGLLMRIEHGNLA